MCFYFCTFLFLNKQLDKDEISNTSTGDGIIAITNWHALIDKDDEDEDTGAQTLGVALSKTRTMIKGVLPVIPGTASDKCVGRTGCTLPAWRYIGIFGTIV